MRKSFELLPYLAVVRPYDRGGNFGKSVGFVSVSDNGPVPESTLGRGTGNLPEQARQKNQRHKSAVIGQTLYSMFSSQLDTPVWNENPASFHLFIMLAWHSIRHER